jgi:uridine monophosphate synthetase
LETIEILKDNIVMVKLHCDIIEDFNSQFVDDLVTLCRANNIFIIEDRKFGDIGNTFKHQFTGGIYKIIDWADLITFHGIVGEGQITEFDKLRKKRTICLTCVSNVEQQKFIRLYLYKKGIRYRRRL